MSNTILIFYSKTSEKWDEMRRDWTHGINCTMARTSGSAMRATSYDLKQYHLCYQIPKKLLRNLIVIRSFIQYHNHKLYRIRHDNKKITTNIDCLHACYYSNIKNVRNNLSKIRRKIPSRVQHETLSDLNNEIF